MIPLQVFIVVISFLLAALGVTSMYNGVYIPPAKLILISGLTTVVIYFIVKQIQQSKNKKLDKLMSITMTLFGAMFLSSLIYSVWDMEKFFISIDDDEINIDITWYNRSISERRLHPCRNILQEKAW